MKVDIINNYHINIKELDLKERGRLKSQIKLVLKSLGLPEKSEVCITFVDDVTMRALNKTYRRIDKATDVLSFPQDVEDLVKLNSAIAKPKENLILGDIVISVDMTKRSTERYGKNLKDEINKLIIHGILHLIGYDHKEKKKRNIMRKKEEELLKIISPPEGELLKIINPPEVD